MKAMSKLFLIIAGILVVIGAILMIIGGVSAKRQGVQLYPKNDDGRYIYTVDLADKDIAKVEIDASDADVRVMTGEDTEYIEFINFNENYYSISTTNKIVKFEERVSLQTLFSFWDGSYTFKGMRNILNLGGKPDGPKEILIHLKDTSKIKVFNFTISDGDISVATADSDTDYTVTMNSGNVVFKNVSTTSKVVINGNDCKVDLENCSFKYFASDIANVNMKADVKDVHSFEFTGKTGTVDADIEADSADFDVLISSDSSISYNGQTYNGNYSSNDKTTAVTEEFAKVHVDGEAIGITIDFTAPEKTEEETK